MDINGMKILSIDDNHLNLKIIESFVKPLNLILNSFVNSQDALHAAINNKYDLILIDYQMPELNGLEFIEAYRKVDHIVPIIMITTFGKDIELQVQALELGVSDFISKPMNAASFKARVNNTLKLRKSQLLIENKTLLLEEEVRQMTKIIHENELETLDVLGRSSEFRDQDTGLHTYRVAKYCKILASLAGLGENEQDVIFHASPFHDLGKIGICDEILLKPGKLDYDEFEIMKTHAQVGYNILKDSKSKYLKAGAQIAILHHEKFDGKGYPKGLKGEEIPIIGRITAIADVFDALTSVRPYKKAWNFDDACALIEEERNKHFDPKLADLFLENKSQFKEIYDLYKDK